MTKANVHYILIQSLYWMTYCTVSGYVSSFLRAVGFVDSSIGILVAVVGISSSLLQALLAGWIDLSGRRLLKPAAVSFLLLAIGVSGMLLLFPAMPVGLQGISFAVIMCSLQVTQPLVNTMSVCARERVSFSTARAIASLAFAGLSFLIGQLLAGFGVAVLSIARMGFGLVLLFCILTFPVRITHQQAMKKRQKNSGFFRRNKGFAVLMLGSLLAYFSHVLMNYYNYQIVLSKGGDNASLGIMLFLAAMVEVPVMLFYPRLQRLAVSGFWFVFSGFGFAVKAAAFLLAPDLTVFYAAQISQMFGWAMISVASVAYVREVTREEDTTRGQAYITLTYTGAMVLGSLSGGFLLQYQGVAMLLLTALVTAVLSGFVLLTGVRRIGSGVRGSRSPEDRYGISDRNEKSPAADPASYWK